MIDDEIFTQLIGAVNGVEGVALEPHGLILFQVVCNRGTIEESLVMELSPFGHLSRGYEV